MVAWNKKQGAAVNDGELSLALCVCTEGANMGFDYYGGKWKKKRKHILKLDGYKCRIAAMYGRTEEANTIHHIYPADEHPEYAWCDWNLISVSSANHNRLENRMTGELTKLGEMLKKRTKPGIDWRKKRSA